MALTSNLLVTVASKLTAAQDLGQAVASMAKSYEVSLTDGTTAGKADKVFHDTRTLAASATEDIDLTGVLADPLGVTLSFVKVKALIVAAAAGNTNNVIVGGASSAGFVSWVGGATHTVTVRPGAVLALVAGESDSTGYGVTATTADLLKIANSAGTTSVTFDLIVIGTSA